MGNLPKSVLIPIDIFESLCRIHLTKDAKPSEILEIEIFLSEKLKNTLTHAEYEPRKPGQKSE